VSRDPDRLEAASRLAHRDLLTGIERKVHPQHAALIVVDVLNDFCAPGGMMDAEEQDLERVQKMADRLPPLIDSARRAGSLVVFVRNVYSSPHNSYLSDVWLEQASRRRGDSYTTRDVCAADSWEGSFYGGIKPLPGEPVVTKHRFSAFHNTDLDTILRANGIRTLIMSGVATNVCVETTAREGYVRDYYIVFLSDGTACYSDADQAATLSVMDRFFGEVVTVSEVAHIWDELGASAPSQPDPESRAAQNVLS
jgi:ureidoacrylate peracid hydrolase